MHRLPPEVLTSILCLAVDRGSKTHAEQLIPPTHVCRYWRTALLSYPSIWSTLCLTPGNPSVISEWLARSKKVPLTIIAEFTDVYDHSPCPYEDSATVTLADTDFNFDACPRHEAILALDQLLPLEYGTSTSCFIRPVQIGWAMTMMTCMANQHSYTITSSGSPFRICGVWSSVPLMSNTADIRSPLPPHGSRKACLTLESSSTSGHPVVY